MATLKSQGGFSPTGGDVLKRLVLSAPILGLLLLAIAACASEPESVAAPVRYSPPPPPPAPTAAADAAATDSLAAQQAGGGTPVTVGLLDNDGRGPFIYEPADFVFSVGETVTFTLTSEAAYHTFTIEGTPIDVDVDIGETKEVTYTFSEAGTYNLICIPHELLEMVGVITVQ